MTTEAPGFLVQRRMCATCIYRPGFGRDIEALEDQARERVRGKPIDFFKSYRSCHHAKNKEGVCCRAFWNRHRDKCQITQLAQRLKLVRFVDRDVLK